VKEAASTLGLPTAPLLLDHEPACRCGLTLSLITSPGGG
jgi:hypothetical protein